MGNRSTLFLLILFASGQYIFAQDVPHIDGELNVSVKSGSLTGKFYLSNLPKLGKNYALLLNRGLNLHFFKDSTQKVLNYGHDFVKLDYEALEYWLANKEDTLSLPRNLFVSYVGRFPVYTDTLNAFDDMGVVAFNGKTFRATDQTRWYPVVRDTRNDRVYDEVTYRIKVVCPDCKAIYINGDEAQATTQALLKSDIPKRMTIFAGDYQVQKFDNVTFLNAMLSEKQATVFDEMVKSIQKFYSAKLRIHYKQRITFLKHQAIEEFNEGRSWGFVSFPTIAVAGVGFKEQVSDTVIKNFGSFAFYAHELGHYYFGTVWRPNSELAPFFMESTTEYLSIKATESRYGKAFTTNYLTEKKAILKNKKLVPLNRVTKSEEISSEYYRYSCGPLLLLGLESIVGEQKMYELLHHILSQSGQRTNYTFLKQSAFEVGISKQDWQQFEDQFVEVEAGLELVAKIVAIQK